MARRSLFALPNKIGMTEAQYFIAQSVYQGWSMLALVLIPAMLLNVAFAILLSGVSGRDLFSRWRACLCMFATLAVFFAFTYPANVATAELDRFARQLGAAAAAMGILHAANAGLIFLSFCFLALAALSQRGAGSATAPFRPACSSPALRR